MRSFPACCERAKPKREAAQACAAVAVALVFWRRILVLATWFKLIVNLCKTRGKLDRKRGRTDVLPPVRSAMSVEGSVRPRSAFCVVLGNEKGGSGKSTVAMHIAVALLKAGQRVATIDLDSRQKSFTHYIENRKAWAKHARLDLELPSHYCVARSDGALVADNEAAEFNDFASAIDAIEHTHDFIVIDTPGHDSYLMRLAHSMADTLITPLNDSFVDFDVLGTVDPVTFAVTGTSHFSEMVREARHHRRVVDQATTDWIVVRNRLSMLGSRNKKLVGEALNELA